MSRLYSADMASFPRYAIYYAPAPSSDLDRFGAQLLGYDAMGGADLPFPDGIIETVPDWRDLTRDPRKYGFHATLKAPLALAPGKTEAELRAACETFAGTPRPIPVIHPVVDSISGFVALVPSAPSAELLRLAADCVRDFDQFREPLTPEDRARRNPAALTPRQREHLERWGYPYVLDEFRLHLTLTNALVDAETIAAGLTAEFERSVESPELRVDALALFAEEGVGAPFRLVRRFPFGAGEFNPS